MDLRPGAGFFRPAGRADGIEVHLTNLDATGQVTSAMRKCFPSALSGCATGSSKPVRLGRIRDAQEGLRMVLMMLIAVAAFNLVAMLIMVVMEKRKDIAILMAMGATRGADPPDLHHQGDDYRCGGYNRRFGAGCGGMLYPGPLPLHPYTRARYMGYPPFRSRSPAVSYGWHGRDGVVSVRHDISRASGLHAVAGRGYSLGIRRWKTMLRQPASRCRCAGGNRGHLPPGGASVFRGRVRTGLPVSLGFRITSVS